MKLIDHLKEYFRSSKSELQAVAWPSREETLRYTGLVVGVSIIFGLFFGVFDFGLTRLVELTISRQTTTVQPEQPTTTDNTNPINPTDIKVETASGTGGVTITPVTPSSTK